MSKGQQETLVGKGADKVEGGVPVVSQSPCAEAGSGITAGSCGANSVG